MKDPSQIEKNSIMRQKNGQFNNTIDDIGGIQRVGQIDITGLGAGVAS